MNPSEMSNEMIAFRLVALPMALESIVDTMVRSRKMLKEFVIDYDSALLAEAVLFDRFTSLIRHVIEAESVQDFERMLDRDLAAAEAAGVEAAEARRAEALEARREGLEELERLGLTDDTHPGAKRLLGGYRQLMDALPDMAAEAQDEVTFELLFAQKCEELDVREFLDAIGDDDDVQG